MNAIRCSFLITLAYITDKFTDGSSQIIKKSMKLYNNLEVFTRIASLIGFLGGFLSIIFFIAFLAGDSFVDYPWRFFTFSIIVLVAWVIVFFIEYLESRKMSQFYFLLIPFLLCGYNTYFSFKMYNLKIYANTYITDYKELIYSCVNDKTVTELYDSLSNIKFWLKDSKSQENNMPKKIAIPVLPIGDDNKIDFRIIDAKYAAKGNEIPKTILITKTRYINQDNINEYACILLIFGVYEKDTFKIIGYNTFVSHLSHQFKGEANSANYRINDAKKYVNLLCGN